MKPAYLTLRISAALERALDRMARRRGVSKSQLVREAVASYSGNPPSALEERSGVTGAELAKRWVTLPRLDADEVKTFALDVAGSREALPPPAARWE